MLLTLKKIEKRHLEKGNDKMAWVEVIKGSKAVYSGTCPKCKKFISRGEQCPLNLPAKTPELKTIDACPMKLER